MKKSLYIKVTWDNKGLNKNCIPDVKTISRVLNDYYITIGPHPNNILTSITEIKRKTK